MMSRSDNWRKRISTDLADLQLVYDEREIYISDCSDEWADTLIGSQLIEEQETLAEILDLLSGIVSN